MSANGAEASDDEWEEVVVVAEVNGVLDAQLVRQAVSKGHVNLRDATTAAPILQIANSLYTGKWMRTVGTDIVLESDNNQLRVLSTTDKMLKTEKALLTAKEGTAKSGTADEKMDISDVAIKSEGHSGTA